MAVFTMFGSTVELPAVSLPARERTQHSSAWLHGAYVSVLLHALVKAIRVHTAGRNFYGRPASRESGAWLLIGDVVMPRSEIADSRALPVRDLHGFTAFTHASEAFVYPGTVLNIGLAAPADVAMSCVEFPGSGGGFQAEFVSGPGMTFEPLRDKVWLDTAARA